MTLVCGDSHSSTHGAFGALAFGIGARECETVLATQTQRRTRAKTMAVGIEGRQGAGAPTHLMSPASPPLRRYGPAAG